MSAGAHGDAAAGDQADVVPQALVFVAWARIWSPLVEDALRREAWQALGLPGDFDALTGDFLRAFHVAMPQPAATLLLHAALNQDGGGVREDFVRIMDYLAIDYDDGGRLPPDHLACACELFAVALQAGEPVLVDGLRERYLAPWAQMAQAALAGHALLSAVVAQFSEDVGAA